jgi:hypothetical protein
MTASWKSARSTNDALSRSGFQTGTTFFLNDGTGAFDVVEGEELLPLSRFQGRPGRRVGAWAHSCRLWLCRRGSGALAIHLAMLANRVSRRHPAALQIRIRGPPTARPHRDSSCSKAFMLSWWGSATASGQCQAFCVDADFAAASLPEAAGSYGCSVSNWRTWTIVEFGQLIVDIPHRGFLPFGRNP